MALADTIASGLVGVGLDRVAKGLEQIRADASVKKVSVDDTQSRDALMWHLEAVDKWAGTIALQSLFREKKLAESFVDLNIALGKGRDTQRISGETIEEVLRTSRHFALLGQPGAGKTTSLQRVATSILARWQAGDLGPPLLVRLRDLREDDRLVSFLLAKLGVRIVGKEKLEARELEEMQNRLLLQYLEKLGATILVDGLDEVHPTCRPRVESDLQLLALSGRDCRLIVTCRTSDFSVGFQGVQSYTLLPLNDAQVLAFATRWLGTGHANAFLRALRQNPYAGTEILPLTMAHLCALYERDGRLPPKPIEIYEQIISLLIEQWDRQRGVKRYSRYDDFEWRKKERFLQAIAFELTKSGCKGSFSHQQLAAIFPKVRVEFDLPSFEERTVIEEIESHTGIVYQSGFGQFDFVHLVIQEFLTAMHVGRGANAVKELVPNHPNEMALVIAYSTEPTEYLERAVERLLVVPAAEAEGFLAPFLARILLERVSINDSTRVGWIVLEMAEIATSHLLRTPDVDYRTKPDAITKFLTTEAVRTATTSALKRAAVYPEREGSRVVPSPNSGVPPWLGEALRAKPSAGFFVAEKYLMAITRTGV